MGARDSAHQPFSRFFPLANTTHLYASAETCMILARTANIYITVQFLYYRPLLTFGGRAGNVTIHTGIRFLILHLEYNDTGIRFLILHLEYVFYNALLHCMCVCVCLCACRLSQGCMQVHMTWPECVCVFVYVCVCVLANCLKAACKCA